MISVPEVVVERVAAAIGSGESLVDLATRSARAVGAEGVVAVIAATFSNPERFPSLAVRVAASLGLPPSVAAFDLQMACSAYPYAIYLAGRLSADLGGKALVIDGTPRGRYFPTHAPRQSSPRIQAAQAISTFSRARTRRFSALRAGL